MAAAPASYPQRRFALPPDACEVVLVRHGASIPAVPGVSHPMRDGHGDPPLAPEGEAQAARVAARLAGGEPLAALAHTGLQRTVQTLAPLAAATGLAPTEVPRLREVRLGEWEGGEFRIRMASGDPLAMRILAEERWDLIPGAEPMEEIAGRVRAGIAELVALAGPGRRVAAVVHGGILGEICRQATGSRPFAFVHADNGSLSSLIVFADARWLLRSFNDTAHLD
jgi:probable phosphoglycerate mutase